MRLRKGLRAIMPDIDAPRSGIARPFKPAINYISADIGGAGVRRPSGPAHRSEGWKAPRLEEGSSTSAVRRGASTCGGASMMRVGG